jgi:hypothetical protein
MTFDERIAAKFAHVELEREQMHDYQANIAVPFLKENPFSALFIDLGLGKTICSLTVISDLLADLNVKGKVLVVGPLRVMTDTWPSEIVKWRHTAAFNFTLIRVDDDDERLREARRAGGSKAETAERHRIMEELAMSRATIHFINREWLVWLVNLHGPRWPYRIVFIDESSSFKDYSTSRFKALAKVRRTPGLITRLHLLTATPAAETYEHLFAQIYLLDLGHRLGKNITHYRENYFTYNRWSMKWKLREGCEEQILDKIKDICLVMKKKDYLNLPEPMIVPRVVRLSAKQRALYDEMRTEFVVTLPGGAEIEAETAASLSSKLLQMASGVLYETYEELDWDTEDMRKVRKVHHLHDHKIEALREIVEGLDGNPVLVGYWFKSSLDRLVKAFPKATVMDKAGKCIKAWNAGKIPVLLMHPQSGGHGLNLQSGGHNMVFFDIPWSLELFLQFVGRLDRQGQTNSVLVQLLVAEGTLDEEVFAALRSKEDAQERLFLILKRMIRKFRKERQTAQSTRRILVGCARPVLRP